MPGKNVNLFFDADENYVIVNNYIANNDPGNYGIENNVTVENSLLQTVFSKNIEKPKLCLFHPIIVKKKQIKKLHEKWIK